MSQSEGRVWLAAVQDLLQGACSDTRAGRRDRHTAAAHRGGTWDLLAGQAWRAYSGLAGPRPRALQPEQAKQTPCRYTAHGLRGPHFPVGLLPSQHATHGRPGGLHAVAAAQEMPHGGLSIELSLASRAPRSCDHIPAPSPLSSTARQAPAFQLGAPPSPRAQRLASTPRNLLSMQQTAVLALLCAVMAAAALPAAAQVGGACPRGWGPVPSASAERLAKIGFEAWSKQAQKSVCDRYPRFWSAGLQSPYGAPPPPRAPHVIRSNSAAATQVSSTPPLTQSLPAAACPPALANPQA